jgi:Na+/proline symporter
MSSADSSLLAASSLLVNNVICPLRPNASDKSILFCTRITTVVLLVLATYLAMKVESIYALMTSCWASQLVVVLIPVLAAIYCPKASSATIWSTMIVATAVWVAYIFITGMGIEGSFSEKLSSPDFEYQLTNGAVFGFGAGIIAFFSSYFGERISKRLRTDKDSDEDRPRKKHKKRKKHLQELQTESAEA